MSLHVPPSLGLNGDIPGPSRADDASGLPSGPPFGGGRGQARLRESALRGAAWIVVPIVAVLAIGLFLSATTVQAGYVGVVLTFGRAEPRVLAPGFHVIVPLAQRIVRVDTRVLPHAFKQIDAASRELQSVKLTGTMNYHLQAERAHELYQTVGLDFADKVIDPAFSDFIKEVVPQYPVTEILAKREEIRLKAKEKLGANLARYGIVVDDIYIADIAYSSDYQTAIERKQTAQQNVETEQQVLRQKEIQAQQAVVEARGKADAAVAAAEGEAKANLARAATISPQLIEYLRWTRWDGRLPAVVGGEASLVGLPPELVGDTAAPATPARPSP
jgi:regulator of protease activity HflC (stomatin/prohibitin superfamily)